MKLRPPMGAHGLTYAIGGLAVDGVTNSRGCLWPPPSDFEWRPSPPCRLGTQPGREAPTPLPHPTPIAYMDYLEIPIERAAHNFNHALSRICHVTQDDFNFVQHIDRSRVELHAFGRLPIRKDSPYAPQAMPPPHMPDQADARVHPLTGDQQKEDIAQPSFNEWTHDCACSNQYPPSAAPTVDVESLPVEYQLLLAEHNSLVHQEFTDLGVAMQQQGQALLTTLVKSMKQQGQTLIQKRCGEFAVKCFNLNKRMNEVADLTSKMRNMNKPSNDIDDGPPDLSFPGGGSSDDPDSTQGGAKDHNPPPGVGRSGKDMSADGSPKERELSSSTCKEDATGSQKENDQDGNTKEGKSSPPPSPQVSPKLKPEDGSSNEATLLPPCSPQCSQKAKLEDESTKESALSPPHSPEGNVADLPPQPDDPKRCPSFPMAPSYIYEDDIPSFNLFQPHEAEFEDVCVDQPRSPAPTGMPSDGSPKERETGSSTREKRNRKKRKHLDVGLALKQRRPKPNGDDTREVWSKYVAKRAFAEGFKLEEALDPPPFLRIFGFHVTYDEFYSSFKSKGWVSNNVMSLWSFQYNLDHLFLYQMDTISRLLKFSFPQLASDYLKRDPSIFSNGESIKKLYKNMNTKWLLSKIDLIFFPLVDGGHWVLLCVSIFMKEIAFFDSLHKSETSPCLAVAHNLIMNFATNALEHGFLKCDVSAFEWKYPAVLKQNNLHDCGLYTMVYMDSWDGHELVAPSISKLSQVLGFRKHAAAVLVRSQYNDIAIDSFVQAYEASKGMDNTIIGKKEADKGKEEDEKGKD